MGIYDEKGRTLAILTEPESFVWSLAFSGDGSLLAAADQDGSVWLYDTAGWQNTARLQTGFAPSLAFGADGLRLAVGTETGKLQIWDLADLTQIRSREHEEKVISLSWTARRDLIAAGLWNGDVVISTGETCRPAGGFTNSGGSRRDVNSLSWSPDGRLLAAAHQDARIRVWKPGKASPLHTLPGHVGWVRGISWSPDKKTLASGGSDRKVRLWHARRGKLLAVSDRQAYPIWSLAFAPRGGLLAAGNGLYGDGESSGRIVIYTLSP